MTGFEHLSQASIAKYISDKRQVIILSMSQYFSLFFSTFLSPPLPCHHLSSFLLPHPILLFFFPVSCLLKFRSSAFFIFIRFAPKPRFQISRLPLNISCPFVAFPLLCTRNVHFLSYRNAKAGKKTILSFSYQLNRKKTLRLRENSTNIKINARK